MELNKVRIPGKVMLSGEYAVLYGARAVLLPVPRYLELAETSHKRKKPYSKVVCSALNYNLPKTASHEISHGLPDLKIKYTSFFARDEHDKRAKLGLGCSAAEAVGVIALRYKRAGMSLMGKASEIFKHAVKAHADAQAGLGSGADVAACAYGKPICFQVGRENSIYNIKDPVYRNKSDDLPLNLAWTGKAADTRLLVGKFMRWVDSGDKSAKNYLGRLIKINNRLADSWFESSTKELFAILDELDRIMMECAYRAKLQYKLPVHMRIEKWAKRNGGRTKPTGAGGGDMILLIGELPITGLKRLTIPLKPLDLKHET
jgi:phosphomevalonate kinase